MDTNEPKITTVPDGEKLCIYDVRFRSMKDWTTESKIPIQANELKLVRTREEVIRSHFLFLLISYKLWRKEMW